MQFNVIANCEKFDLFFTMTEGMADIDMFTKGTDIMRKEDDDDRRLTPVERVIRDRCANVPKHRRRSIDAYRRALGFTPLWGSSLERNGRR